MDVVLVNFQYEIETPILDVLDESTKLLVIGTRIPYIYDITGIKGCR